MKSFRTGVSTKHYYPCVLLYSSKRWPVLINPCRAGKYYPYLTDKLSTVRENDLPMATEGVSGRADIVTQASLSPICVGRPPCHAAINYRKLW